jgi:hypothetical protein
VKQYDQELSFETFVRVALSFRQKEAPEDFATWCMEIMRAKQYLELATVMYSEYTTRKPPVLMSAEAATRQLTGLNRADQALELIARFLADNPSFQVCWQLDGRFDTRFLTTCLYSFQQWNNVRKKTKK